MGDLLDGIPLNQKQQIWLKHDGSPVHFSIAVTEHLYKILDKGG